MLIKIHEDYCSIDFEYEHEQIGYFSICEQLRYHYWEKLKLAVK